MYLIGSLNFLIGIFLILDTRIRLLTNTRVLYFDGYFLGFAKYIPLAIGIIMVLASLGIIIFRRSFYVVVEYIASFIFIIFYTPTALFMRNDREEIQFLLVVEFAILLISIVVLYTSHDKGRFKSKSTRITYEDYKRSMSRLSDMRNDENQI